MLHVKEFEELEQKLKHEMQLPKAIESSSIMNINEPMSEEEKRLIEASALDEDLRILPQAFTLPPAFQNVSPPSQSSASSNSQIASLNSMISMRIIPQLMPRTLYQIIRLQYLGRPLQ
ncbi:Zinc finger CCCH domain-containing protein 8 [Sarcoptes scabiei]|nr:Zinc finger CCCH domain-containing protein 8 [Sarcoptes scabiei]